MTTLPIHTFLFAVLCICMALTGCTRSSSTVAAMDTADSLIESRPDSAYALLAAIDPATLGAERERARYALLMSMALDKNYIDTTDFAVLQPAIDYYLTKGSPDERLRTLYYMGRIYQNGGNDDMAMAAFMDGAELRDAVTDSLVLGRLYVMQGVLYSAQYRLGSATDKYLQAADLFRSNNPRLAMDCYIRALYGDITNHSKVRADSIMGICDQMIDSFPEYHDAFDTQRISYQINFGSESDIRRALDDIKQSEHNDFLKYASARAFIQLGDGSSAIASLDLINADNTEIPLDQYYISKAEALYLTKDFQKAADAYALFIDKFGKDVAYLINSNLPYSGKQHELKMQQQHELSDKNLLILISGLIACILAFICLLIAYLLHRQRTKHLITEQANRNLQLELEAKTREKEKIEIEKQASILELENTRLQKDAADLALYNLQLEKTRLETESENLRELLNEKTDLDEAVLSVIRDRLNMLNSLIAQDITKNESFGSPYHRFLEQIQNDKVQFMESTRLAFSASHPKFIQHLQDCGLTTDEINFCCLYAIGLRGKEVGEYTQSKRHYILSSTIRKKLGLTEHQTNLNKYIQGLLD